LYELFLINIKELVTHHLLIRVISIQHDCLSSAEHKRRLLRKVRWVHESFWDKWI